MINRTHVKTLLEAAGSHSQFVRNVFHNLGISDASGNRYRDYAGNPEIRNPAGTNDRWRPREFSIRSLAEALIGEDWDAKMNPGIMQRVSMMEAEHPILEAGANAVTPTAFANINAFTAVVTGLLEISIMEGWKNPQFIGDRLMPTEPSRMFDGRKVIGTTRIGRQAEPRTPGMPTKRAGFGERWIVQPRTVENALSCEVLQETVFLDLTGEVLEQANGVGLWVGWERELRQIQAFVGSALYQTYNYKGTTTAGYLAASTWDNDITSGNELVDYTSVEKVLFKFRDMLDVETGTRVLISPTKVLVNQEKLFTARRIFLADGVEYQSTPGSVASTTNYGPILRTNSSNPLAGDNYEILSSPLVYQVCTDTTANGGLALSATAAGKLWFMWDSISPPLKYVQNWPLRVQQAAPAQADMIDRGVILYVKADERGIPMWYEPRRIVRSAA